MKIVQFNLAFMRMARGRYTQREIALSTGLSQKTLSALETGASKGIEFSTISKLCDFLKCTPNDLLVLEEEIIDEPPSQETLNKAREIVVRGLQKAMDAPKQTPEEIWLKFDILREKIQAQAQQQDLHSGLSD